MGTPPLTTRCSAASLPTFARQAESFADALALRGKGIIQFGLLLLIATPVARVAFSIFGFAEERDRLYVVVASIVLSGFGLTALSGPAGLRNNRGWEHP